MVEFITGTDRNAGSLKLMDAVLENEKRGRTCLIVPEQYAMQANIQLLKRRMQLRGEDEAAMTVEVLSFRSLALKLTNKLNINFSLPLDEVSKMLIIHNISSEINREKKLNFKIDCNRQGNLKELKSTISEFEQYGVTTGDLENLIDNISDPALENKLLYILEVYKRYRDFLKEKNLYSDALENLPYLIESSGYFKGTFVAFDEFNGFTPPQREIISLIMKQADNTVFTIASDSKDIVDVKGLIYENALFFPGRRTMYQLYENAKEQGLEIKINHSEEKKKDIYESLERYRKIEILACDDPVIEVEKLCNTIYSLVCDEGQRYKDITIISGDVELYTPILKSRLSQYDIPYFSDTTLQLIEHPFSEHIILLVDMVASGFAFEPVFRFLKSGYVDLHRSVIEKNENRAMRYNLRGFKKYSTMEGFEEFFQELEETVEILNKGSVSEKVRALYDYIIREKIYEKLEREGEMLESKGFIEQANNTENVYKPFMEVMEKLYYLMGEEQMDAAGFSDLLKAGLGERKLSRIPPKIDCIQIGDINRSRRAGSKTVFIIGFNDGVLPSVTKKSGLLNNSDREVFESREVELSNTATQDALVQRYDTYKSLVSGEDRLILSYTLSDLTGSAMKASYIIEDIEKQLNLKSKRIGSDDRLKIENTGNLRAGFKLLGSLTGIKKHRPDLWNKNSNYGKALNKLVSCYSENPQYEMKLHWLSDYSNDFRNKGLEKDIAEKLYKKDYSVTELERFAKCPYAHFLQYGLRLRERRGFDSDLRDYGNIVHKSLNNIFNMGKDDEAARIEAVKSAIISETDMRIRDTVYEQYITDRILRLLYKNLKVLQHQQEKGAYRQKYSEKPFRGNLGKGRRIKGFIDRIDIAETGDGNYLKVTDYKTGNVTFSLNEFYYGLQLQLPLYMGAAREMLVKEENIKELIPGGFFYYHIKDPLLEAGKGGAEELLFKELRLDGVFNSEKPAITLLDRDLEKPSYKSSVINASTLKSGAFSKRMDKFERSDLELIEEFAGYKAASLIDSIEAGQKEVSPKIISGSNFSPCDFCPYNNVCALDKRSRDSYLQVLDKLKGEESMNRIREVLNG